MSRGIITLILQLLSYCNGILSKISSSYMISHHMLFLSLYQLIHILSLTIMLSPPYLLPSSCFFFGSCPSVIFSFILSLFRFNQFFHFLSIFFVLIMVFLYWDFLLNFFCFYFTIPFSLCLYLFYHNSRLPLLIFKCLPLVFYVSFTI